MAQVEEAVLGGETQARGQQGSPFSWNRSYTHRPGKKTERPSSQDHHGVAGGGGAQGIIKMLRELLESEAERKKL